MDNGRNVTGGGFGRRRSQRLEVPPIAAPRQPPGRRVARPGGSPRKRLTPAMVAGLILSSLLALICLEAMLSGTSLITPIDARLVNIMRGIGFVLGIPLAVLIILNPHEPIGPGKMLLVILGVPVMTGFMGDRVAWRIADWAEFGFSSAPFTPVRYPIIYGGFGDNGERDSVQIDPFNTRNSTSIALPSAQFSALWPRQSDYCIQVMQRRSASGAVEILTDGKFTLQEPAPATLTLCPEEQAEQERLDQEYRRQQAGSRP